MRKPDFFLLGAPKCGTTSLAAWLQDHERIYLSPTKEPNYFNTDHDPAYRATHSLAAYEREFVGVNEQHCVVGEATVWYLYSAAAVPAILDYAPQARFIVMFRNPVDMAPSLHSQKIRSGHETELNFLKAWKLQDQRRRGQAIPKCCTEASHLLYADACSLGRQYRRLLDRVAPDRVLPLLLEDVKTRPREQYCEVLRFLGVPDDGRDQFERHNSAHHPKSLIAQRVIEIGSAAKKRLGVEKSLGLWKLNRQTDITLDAEIRSELADYFADDVALLSKLLGRNLDHWLCDQNQPAKQAQAAGCKR